MAAMLELCTKYLVFRAKKWIVLFFSAKLYRQSGHVVLPLLLLFGDKIDELWVVWGETKRKLSILKGVFMASTHPHIVIKTFDRAKTLIHLLCRTFKNSATAKAKQRITTKQPCLVDKSNVVKGMAWDWQNMKRRVAGQCDGLVMVCYLGGPWRLKCRPTPYFHLWEMFF